MARVSAPRALDISPSCPVPLDRTEKVGQEVGQDRKCWTERLDRTENVRWDDLSEEMNNHRTKVTAWSAASGS